MPTRAAEWRLRPSTGPGIRPWRMVALASLALIVLAPSAYLAQTGGVLASGYTIQRLRAERNAWRVRNQQLELEVAKARSLAWVETEAITRLRMQQPIDRTVVRVNTPPPAPVVAPVRVASDRTTRSTPRIAP